MSLSKTASASDASVHSTLSSRFVRAYLPRFQIDRYRWKQLIKSKVEFG
ncbi:hypothetical protein SOVF_092440 [Spinacia oleracea]|nr:hypothetical protein SOVF_092440 [Spinacia oleracea]